MTSRPTLHAPPLVLRPFALSDAPRVAELANDEQLTSTLLVVPFPYHESHALAWIEGHEQRLEERRSLDLAMTVHGELVGSIGVELDQRHRRAALGYWVGRSFWGRGFATTAARAMIRYCFETLGTVRVSAYHFVGNEASGRVLEKAGMLREGTMRGLVRKGDRQLDCVMYAVVRDEP